MNDIAISIMAPEGMADDVNDFAKEHSGQVTVKQEVKGGEQARDLGFEPITTTLVVAWVLKFTASAASALLSKLLVDRIYKKLRPEKGGKPTEVQVAFPNGFVLTIRSEDGMDEAQLRKLIEDNIKS